MNIKLVHSNISLNEKKEIIIQINEREKQIQKAIEEIILKKEEEGKRYRVRIKQLEIELTNEKEQKHVRVNEKEIKKLKAEKEKLQSYLLENILLEEEVNIIMAKINEIDENIAQLEQNIEISKTKMSLKYRVKEIFKKHGFTVTAVVTCVGVVIGVIVSNLSSGFSNMAKGIGKGFKDIGEKLANMLPGIVGAIASFIFKTAGEVVGFLAKNAWLLIVAVVVYFVEKLKKKK